MKLKYPLTRNNELWVFGYGSLMWDSGFAHKAMRSVKLHGWHRAFSLYSIMAWGSPPKPGLCASLHAGGSVAGRALLVEAAHVEDVVAQLMIRESAYHPRIVSGKIEGEGTRMLTFVHNYDHPRSAAGISQDEQARLIAQGQGERGTSLFYLSQTLQELANDGARDKQAEALLARVQALKPLFDRP